MNRLPSLLLISLFLFASSSWAQTSSSAKELSKSCLEKYNQKDLDGAIADCNKAIELNPQLSNAYVVRAMILGDKGDLEGAIADLDKAVVLDPRNPVLYKTRGMLKLTKGDIDNALADYDRLIDINPSSESYGRRGMALITKGNYDKAINDLNVAIEKSPESINESVKLYTLRALAKFRKKDWAEAVVDYNMAIKLDPKRPDAYAYRGLALLIQGKDIEAQKDFDKFFELAPDKKAFIERLIEKTKRERTIKK